MEEHYGKTHRVASADEATKDVSYDDAGDDEETIAAKHHPAKSSADIPNKEGENDVPSEGGTRDVTLPPETMDVIVEENRQMPEESNEDVPDNNDRRKRGVLLSMESSGSVLEAPPPSNATADTTTVQTKSRLPLNPGWSRWTDDIFHQRIPQLVLSIALLSIIRPRWTLCIMAALSVALICIGLATNFTLSVEEFEAYAPIGVRPRDHRIWIEEESGYPPDQVVFVTLVHNNGANVVTMDAIQRVFDSYEPIINNVDGYDEICAQSNHVYNGTRTCLVYSVIRYWNYSRAIFEATVSTDEEVAHMLLQDTFPDGTPVDTETILGNHHIVSMADGTKTISGESFTTAFLFPNNDLQAVRALEAAALNTLFPVQEEIKGNQEKYRYTLEINSERSYADEFQRAIIVDMPLIPVAFLVMVLFTCSVFFRRHPVKSRLLMGVGAVVTIVCSTMSGFGLMFICGVPFTNLTMLVPFVIFGIGLDDTFVIVAGFDCTNPEDSMEKRMRQTVKDVGLTITVTTISTVVAFGMGTTSSIPAIRWMCLYAMTTIAVDFIYQITFFIAILILDAQRIQENRKDCCVCVRHTSPHETEQIPERVQESDMASHTGGSTQMSNLMDGVMIWYAERLLHPYVKGGVICWFTVLFGVCAYSASSIRQEFQVTELVPSDSYVIPFLQAFNSYRARSLPTYVYFRFVDQGNNDTQRQMLDFVDELVALDQFVEPRFCWVRDFQTITQNSDLQVALGLTLGNMTFNEQVSYLLANPTVQEIYGRDVVLDDKGAISTSRCLMFTENLNLDVVQEQIDLLNAQEEVSSFQPVNQGQTDWKFFTYDDFYLTWEFYDAIIREMTMSSIVDILSVTVVGFFCIPHWTATLYVFPILVVLFIDLVGIIQMTGLYINIVTYVSLTMSIGLLVDYIVHVLLRYFESKALTREEKVKETLSTLGAAVLSGGLSTLLAILPLAFSTSQIMRTVFIAFIAMVALGCSHGLILLPVILSIVGPETTIIYKGREKKGDEGHQISTFTAKDEDDEQIVQTFSV